jgi:HlyD family secretion protein
MNKILHGAKLGTRVKAIAVVTVGVIVVIFGAWAFSRGTVTIPTAVVERGEFSDAMPFHGEVKAVQSVALSAPSGAGDLQIVRIAPDGVSVKRGDVVVQFDATKTEQDLAQYKSALNSSDAEIAQARAQSRLKEEADRTAVMKARFDVESAKLDASKNEILAEIDGAEKKLLVADAEQRLLQAAAQLKSDRADNAAKIADAEQKRKQNLYKVQQSEHSLAALTLRAPAAGIVALLQVWHPGVGMSVLKAGEQAWPGAAIAELPDLSTLHISMRVDESERGRLQLGQTITAHFDALPDRDFTGQTRQISAIATQDFSGGWPFPRNFDVEIALDQTDARLRPGMGASVRVTVDRVPNAIIIPAQASFQKSGRTVAYVLNGAKFGERTIEVGRRSGDRLLIAKGLQSGEKVAMQDPTLKE